MHVLILLILCLPCFAQEVARLRYERLEGHARVTGHGTAFCIDKNLLLTAAHNVLDDKGEPYNTIHIEVGEDWIKGHVVRFDTSLDLCLIKCNAPLESLKLADADAGKGSKLLLIGSKRGTPLTFHSGVLDRRFTGGTVRTRAKIKFDHGDSGGPVLEKNKVVGIAVAGEPKDGDLDPDICLFVPISAIRSFLDGD